MEQRRNAKVGKREIPEKTRRPAVSSGAIPTCENPGATPPEIEPGFAASLIECLGIDAKRRLTHVRVSNFSVSYYYISNTRHTGGHLEECSLGAGISQFCVAPVQNTHEDFLSSSITSHDRWTEGRLVDTTDDCESSVNRKSRVVMDYPAYHPDSPRSVGIIFSETATRMSLAVERNSLTRARTRRKNCWLLQCRESVYSRQPQCLFTLACRTECTTNQKQGFQHVLLVSVMAMSVRDPVTSAGLAVASISAFIWEKFDFLKQDALKCPRKEVEQATWVVWILHLHLHVHVFISKIFPLQFCGKWHVFLVLATSKYAHQGNACGLPGYVVLSTFHGTWIRGERARGYVVNVLVDTTAWIRHMQVVLRIMGRLHRKYGQPASPVKRLQHLEREDEEAGAHALDLGPCKIEVVSLPLRRLDPLAESKSKREKKRVRESGDRVRVREIWTARNNKVLRANEVRMERRRMQDRGKRESPEKTKPLRVGAMVYKIREPVQPISMPLSHSPKRAGKSTRNFRSLRVEATSPSLLLRLANLHRLFTVKAEEKFSFGTKLVAFIVYSLYEAKEKRGKGEECLRTMFLLLTSEYPACTKAPRVRNIDMPVACTAVHVISGDERILYALLLIVLQAGKQSSESGYGWLATLQLAAPRAGVNLSVRPAHWPEAGRRVPLRHGVPRKWHTDALLPPYFHKLLHKTGRADTSAALLKVPVYLALEVRCSVFEIHTRAVECFQDLKLIRNAISEHAKIAKNGLFKALYLKMYMSDPYKTSQGACIEPSYRLSTNKIIRSPLSGGGGRDASGSVDFNAPSNLRVVFDLYWRVVKLQGHLKSCSSKSSTQILNAIVDRLARRGDEVTVFNTETRNYFPSAIGNFTGRVPVTVPFQIYAGRSSDICQRLIFKSARVTLNTLFEGGKEGQDSPECSLLQRGKRLDTAGAIHVELLASLSTAAPRDLRFFNRNRQDECDDAQARIYLTSNIPIL
ncbi:hypothetical protein PR048_014884 [Dryococelus australis]|uniref:Uncharacterized protein n=1 Tax=Dryococelus australis TaxID=614101 RepID=A0ABQ9HFM8_9NEOP|nr:hypothetical protein PR048_014884 [Dryococelus australis]